MKKFLVSILLIGQTIMAATLSYININNTDIPLIEETDHRLPIVSFQIIFRYSGYIADENRHGVSKLTAKILNEGTKKLGSTKFANLLESKAIHISAYSGTETFVLEVSCLKEQFGEALLRLKELLTDPNLTTEALKKVKIDTIGYIKSKENDFDYIASKELKSLLYKDTPLAYESTGNIEDVEKISLEDIKNFIKKHLVYSRAIITIGGDINSKDTQKLKEILSVLPKGQNKQLPFFEASSKQETKIIKKDTKQAYIYFGSPFYLKVDDKDYYKAKVAMFILGSGGFGSRLMETIRVKNGLAYSAYARVSINNSYSYFSGYMQTKLESQDKAIKLTKKTIKEFVQNGVTKEELQQAKKFLLGSEPLRVESMQQRLNRAFMEYYKGHKLGYTKEELKLIQNLKLDELNDFIKKHKEILRVSIAIVTK